MKKLIALVLSLVCVLGLVGCKPDGATDLIELGEVSAFVSEKGYTAEDFNEKLVGQFNEDIIHSWGEADIQFSGFWGHSWYLDDNNDKYISLYYDENGYIKDIVIGNRADQTANSIITDIVTEGIVSARFDNHIPNYIYDIEDLTIVDELLATLDGATYEVCERPKEPWGSIEAIYITTNGNEYYLGVIENSAFRISVNGEGEYYTCSHKDNFLNKLLELQGR